MASTAASTAAPNLALGNVTQVVRKTSTRKLYIRQVSIEFCQNLRAVNYSLTFRPRTISDIAFNTNTIPSQALVAKIETSTRRMVVHYKMKDPRALSRPEVRGRTYSCRRIQVRATLVSNLIAARSTCIRPSNAMPL